MSIIPQQEKKKVWYYRPKGIKNQFTDWDLWISIPITHLYYISQIPGPDNPPIIFLLNINKNSACV